MKTHRYVEIKSEQPPAGEWFFAFSDQQFDEGLDSVGIRGQKIINGGYGSYGTKKGIDDLWAFYAKQAERISRECNPQDIYHYEYTNHECGYKCDDTEAIDMVIHYFGKEKAKTVKRKNAYQPI
jgi:hypothetical protein